MRLLLALLLLGACATRSPVVVPAALPPLAYPPSAAARVLRIARAEWQDWGAPIRDAWTDSAAPAFSRESAPENFPRVLAYWRAVENDENAIRDNRRLYTAALSGLGEGALWAEPAWSAAFISYVLRSAGVDAREFPPNAAHAMYLDALTADARAFPDLAPFLPHAPADYAPRPGDLVCLDRSRAPLRDWAERQAEIGRPRPMHCDIVTATPPGSIEAIGGNVADAVTMTRYPADAAGRLPPAPPGRLPVLVVMESRLGRLPPWSPQMETAAR